MPWSQLLLMHADLFMVAYNRSKQLAVMDNQHVLAVMGHVLAQLLLVKAKANQLSRKIRVKGNYIRVF